MSTHRPLFRLLPAILLGTLAQAAGAADRPAVTIEIDGVEGEFAGVARDSLELSEYLNRDLSAAQLTRLTRLGEEEIRHGLEPWGYYDVQVRSELAGVEGSYRAIFHVELGERVIVRSERVEVAGPGAEHEDVKKAVEAFEPRVDEALDHWLYEINKAQIATTLQANGFLDSEMTSHRVEVTRASRSATIDLGWNSGQRYRMGAVRFSGNHLPERFLARYVPWKPGDYYTVEELLHLQQRLVDADYFQSVSVTPDLEHRGDGTVPVDVALVPAKRTIYTASAFVSTDTGPGGTVGVQQRWINQRGHKAGIELQYATRLESYSAFYRIPRPGLSSKLYSIAIGYRDEETDTSRSRLRRLLVNEQVDNWHGYARTLGLQYLNGNYEVAQQLLSSKLIYAEAMLLRRRADDLLFPTRGVSVTYTAHVAAEPLLSDTSLLSLRADVKWVRPLPASSRLILRASAGALEATDFSKLPPELRFFAGGDRSVRGFDYQQIGERRPGCIDDETDKTRNCVLGGRYLTTGSVELEHYFTESWGGAVFVDGGDAYTSELNANVGAGVGVRWRSPVGVVRVDIAVPVRTDTQDRGLRFHVMIGPDL